MFNIFIERNDNINFSRINEVGFDYIRRKYRYELEHILTYYRNREAAVSNGHILYRLINSTLPSLELSELDYFKTVANSAIYIARQLNITSNVNSGIVHNNEFFGKNSLEVLLYTETDYDFQHIKNNYINIDSVRVIYTEETALDFNIPYNNKVYRNETLQTIEIDAIMLLMQYRYWAIDRIANDRSTNINFFLHMVILPNMLYNMLDLAIFNRYIAIANNTPIPLFTIKHPFNVIDYSSGIDKILKHIVIQTKNKNMNIIQLINYIPTIYSIDMLTALKINHQYFTTQAMWVLWISRIRILTELFLLMNRPGVRRNLDIVNMSYYSIKQMIRSTTINNKFGSDSDIYIVFNSYLDVLLELRKYGGINERDTESDK